jgi:hypothetical protein
VEELRLAMFMMVSDRAGHLLDLLPPAGAPYKESEVFYLRLVNRRQ